MPLILIILAVVLAFYVDDSSAVDLNIGPSGNSYSVYPLTEAQHKDYVFPSKDYQFPSGLILSRIQMIIYLWE